MGLWQWMCHLEPGCLRKGARFPSMDEEDHLGRRVFLLWPSYNSFFSYNRFFSYNNFFSYNSFFCYNNCRTSYCHNWSRLWQLWQLRQLWQLQLRGLSKKVPTNISLVSIGLTLPFTYLAKLQLLNV